MVTESLIINISSNHVKDILIIFSLMSGCVSSFFEYLYLLDRKKGLHQPKNRLHAVIFSVVTTSITIIVPIFQFSKFSHFLTYDWQLILIFFALIIGANTIGRMAILTLWYIISGYKNKPIIQTKLHKIFVCLSVSILGAYYFMWCLLMDKYWLSYNQLVDKCFILFLCVTITIVFDITITIIRNYIISLIFANGDIDAIGVLLPDMEVFLKEVYGYQVDYIQADQRIMKLLEVWKIKKEVLQKQAQARQLQLDKIAEFSEMKLR